MNTHEILDAQAFYIKPSEILQVPFSRFTVEETNSTPTFIPLPLESAEI